MIKKFIVQLTFLIIPFTFVAQPYSGTIFVDADIITSSDSSSFVSLSYSGQGEKTIFDRRVNNWITVNAYLFEVVWNDGLITEAVINPEFESVDLAEIEAEKYGRSIGQLPICLRIDVHEIWINKGVELFGGGNNSILIHTGHTILYENDGILEETLVHEAAHTSLDAMHAESPGWLEAQVLDGGFISDYAEENPIREDIAESFLLWMAVRYRADKISEQDFNLISTAIPNRLNYFDDISCDLFPFELDNMTSLEEFERVNQSIIIYPNPTQDIIQLKIKSETKHRVVIYNALGAAVYNGQLKNNEQIDLGNFPNGVYYLRLDFEGNQIIRKLTKL